MAAYDPSYCTGRTLFCHQLRYADYKGFLSGDLATAPEKDAVSKGIVCRGGSCVIDPYGHDISETVWDMERIIYADLDMEDAAAAKMEFDPCGHYARNDVLSLHVDDK